MKQLITKQFTYHIFISKTLIQVFEIMFEASVERFDEYIANNKVSHVRKEIILKYYV